MPKVRDIDFYIPYSQCSPSLAMKGVQTRICEQNQNTLFVICNWQTMWHNGLFLMPFLQRKRI